MGTTIETQVTLKFCNKHYLQIIQKLKIKMSNDTENSRNVNLLSVNYKMTTFFIKKHCKCNSILLYMYFANIPLLLTKQVFIHRNLDHLQCMIALYENTQNFNHYSLNILPQLLNVISSSEMSNLCPKLTVQFRN